MRIAAETRRRSAVYALVRGGSNALVAALLNFVALGIVALVSLETLDAGAW